MKQLAVLGSPIAHALSPVLHRAAYQAIGLDWTYHAIECLAEQLPGFLHALDESWAGFSLTMPLKRAVLPLLDGASGSVQRTKTANTIVINHGRLFGDSNTDLHGMLQALHATGVTSATFGTVGTGAFAPGLTPRSRQRGVTAGAGSGRRP